MNLVADFIAHSIRGTARLVLFTATVIGILGAAPVHGAPKDDRPPNLVVIVTDNQPHWAMGCAGNKIISTPHLDRLAREGVRFKNAFVTTPICAASRASHFTGQYRRRHGFTFNTAPFSANLAASSYPALLRKGGYLTALIGKFGIESNGKLMVENQERSLGLMFDHFDNFEHWGNSGPQGYFVTQPDGSKRHLTDVTADKATSFLRNQLYLKGRRPFCLTLFFNAPHAQDNDPKQYFWPARFEGLYQDATVPAPHNSDPAFFESQPAFLKSSLGRERWRWRFDTPKKYQSMMKGMFRMVSGIDDAVGRVRTELKRLHLDDRTIILFTSDNGMLFGERGLSDCWLLYEESIRVPLIVYDPRITRKTDQNIVREELALNLDLAPTLLDFAGLRSKTTLDGRSLRPLLKDVPPKKWRDDFLCEHLFVHEKIPKSEGVRSREWKYIRYFDEDPIHEELYDLIADPSERTNLASSPGHTAQLATLRDRCAELLREARSK